MSAVRSTENERSGPVLLVLAFMLSLIVPGVGHVLRGAFRRGIAWAVGLIALELATLFCMPNSVVTLAVVIATGVLGRVASAIDAVRARAVRPRWRRLVVVTTGFLAATILFGLIVDAPLRAYYKTNYQEAFAISSRGMAPALLLGDYVIADKSVYRFRPPQRGDIVVFRYPPDERRDFVKRVVGLPGDELQIREGEVFVNGIPLAEPYVQRPEVKPPAATGACGYRYGCEPILVPPNTYFLMGDNRGNSQDSRHWGFVQREKIVGRVTTVYYSWDGEAHWLRADRIGRRL